MSNRRRCPTGKYRYRDRIGAQFALATIDTADPKRREKRAYRCPACFGMASDQPGTAHQAPPHPFRRNIVTSPAARTAAVWAALSASHEFADHWVQIDAQAVAKGEPGSAGARACAAHVATYTATQALTLLAADRLLGLRLNWRRAALGLAISAGTHYAADRQGNHWRDEKPRGIVKLAAATGHAGWLQRDPGAGYLLDQSWHKACLALAAAVIGGGSR